MMKPYSVLLRLLLPLAAAALVAACTTPKAPTTAETAPGAVSGPTDGPLVVPSLSALPETPARPLSGKFVTSAWSDLPGWGKDDLHGVWTALVRNCRGVVRPSSGNLSVPARAAPRAWQPVCAAVADPARAPAADAPIATLIAANSDSTLMNSHSVNSPDFTISPRPSTMCVWGEIG